MKTSELTGAALDWAVAKCEGHPCSERSNNPFQFKWDTGGLPHSSSDWAQGGPIIEREGINLFQRKGLTAKAGNPWLAYNEKQLEAAGPTPLVAAMRCYVTSKLGDNVELPKELAP